MLLRSCTSLSLLYALVATCGVMAHGAKTPEKLCCQDWELICHIFYVHIWKGSLGSLEPSGLRPPNLWVVRAIRRKWMWRRFVKWEPSSFVPSLLHCAIWKYRSISLNPKILTWNSLIQRITLITQLVVSLVPILFQNPHPVVATTI